MGLFGLFGRGRKNRSRNLQERLEEVELQSRLEGLQDRRNARELRIAAINHPNPNVLLDAADGLYRARGSRGTPPRLVAAPTETRESKIIDVLLARALMDPDEKLDELRERALKRRRLMRDLDDDDDEEDAGPMGNLKQALPMLLLAAPMLLNPQIAERMAPMLERMFGGPQPAPPETPVQPPQTVVYQVQPTEPPLMPPPVPLAAAAESTQSPEPAGAPPEGAHVTVHPSMVLNALRTMEPPAFAAWILGQPGGFGFVEQLAEIPENQLAATLNQYASLPRLGPLAQWGDVIAFLAANPEHAAAVMASVRQAYLEESQAI